MIGLILRPLMPPAALIWFTYTWMALSCCPNSGSDEMSNWPDTLESEITGKTTLMAWAVTPRVLVLAWSTGVGVGVDEAEADTTAAPAPSGDPGVPDGASVSQTIRPTITASTI